MGVSANKEKKEKIMSNPLEFQVKKPYASVLVNALENRGEIPGVNAMLYLERVKKSINAFMVKNMRVELPRYRVKKNKAKYIVFEVIT